MPSLCLKYCHYRRVRGDGNCFYRSVGYSYVEKLILLGAAQIRGFVDSYYLVLHIVRVIYDKGCFSLGPDKGKISSPIKKYMTDIVNMRQKQSAELCLKKFLYNVRASDELDYVYN